MKTKRTNYRYRRCPFLFAPCIATLFALATAGVVTEDSVDNVNYCDLPEFENCEDCADINFQLPNFYGCGLAINDSSIIIDFSYRNLTAFSKGFEDVFCTIEAKFEDIFMDLRGNFLDCEDYANMSDYCDPNTQLSCSNFTQEDICNEYRPCSYDKSSKTCIFETAITSNITIFFHIQLNSDDFSGMTDTRIREHIEQSVEEDIRNNLGITDGMFEVIVEIEYTVTRGHNMDINIYVIFIGKYREASAGSFFEKLSSGTFSSSSTSYLVSATIVSIDYGDKSIYAASSSGPGEVTTGAWVGFGIAFVVSLVIIIVEIVIIAQETKKQRVRKAEMIAMLQSLDDMEEDKDNGTGNENIRKDSIESNKSSSSSSSEVTASFSSEDIFSGAYEESEDDSDYSSDSDDFTSENDD